MTSSLLPVLILGFVIVSYIALRPFSVRVWPFLFDFLCFGGATFILVRHQTFPWRATGGGANGPSLWLHAVAGIWWLLGARVLVAAMSFTLNHNRRDGAKHGSFRSYRRRNLHGGGNSCS